MKISHLLFLSGSVLPLLLPGEDLWAWGQNAAGQLGDGSQTERLTPVRVATDVSDASAGLDHSVYVLEDGRVYAMGDNAAGQLGQGDDEDASTPVEVSVPTAVTQVAAGGEHSLFLTADGDLYVCGSNEYGQLGLGDEVVNALRPTLLDSDVSAISAGIYHTLYRKTDGSLWGTGSNFYGELGQGDTDSISSPVEIATQVEAFAAAAGGLFNARWYPAPYSVYLTADGTLHGMGASYTGQLGRRPLDDFSGLVTTPIVVAENVADFGASSHLAVLHADGRLTVRGRNADAVERYPGSAFFYDGFDEQAAQIDTLEEPDDVVSGPFHTFVRYSDGEIVAYNANGLVQDGVSAPAVLTSAGTTLAPSPGGWSAGFRTSGLVTGHFLLLTEAGADIAWDEPTLAPAGGATDVVPPLDIELAMELQNARGAARIRWFRGTPDDPAGILLTEQDITMRTSSLPAQPVFFARALTPQGAVYVEAATVNIDQSYEGWADAYGLTGDDRAPDADPDGDLLVNAEEHQLLADPTVPGSLELTFDLTTDDVVVEIWIRNDESEAPVLERSLDFITWSAPATNEVGPSEGAGARRFVRARWDSDEPPFSRSNFFRLE